MSASEVQGQLPCRQIPESWPPWQSGALVAIEHTILVAMWNMLTTGEAFNDPGSGYQPGRDPGSTLNKALKSLRDLGYQAELTPATAA